MKSILHIFTGKGHTFTFHKVNILTDNETVIAFKYDALSDGKRKKAVFLKSRIVGYSYSED